MFTFFFYSWNRDLTIILLKVFSKNKTILFYWDWNGGKFLIENHGSITSTSNSAVYYTGGAIDLKGNFSAGVGTMTLTEVCSDDQSIGLGGTNFEPPELMSLTKGELDYLEAFDLHVHSTDGSIWVYGVDHPSYDMRVRKEN